jgi:membrane protease YdiL (CAAX protease family)
MIEESTDYVPDKEPASRVPNLFHFLMFVALTVLEFVLLEVVIVAVRFGCGIPVQVTLKDQGIQLLVQALLYVAVLVSAYFMMPPLWHRPFLVGLEWNWAKVEQQLAWLGLAAGFVAQGVTIFIPHPKDLPVEAIFRNPGIIWFLVVFGVALGPLFEEVMFRGFLLPGIAIVVDWLRIPRGADDVASLENLVAWRSSTGYSAVALIVSSIITSVLFALMHAPQLGFSPAAVGLLTCVSLMLCAVRIKTGSVAASWVVHGSYNLALFVTLFVASGGFRHLDKI